jgi:hypothetical protein
MVPLSSQIRSDSGERRQWAIFTDKGVGEKGWYTAWLLKS